VRQCVIPIALGLIPAAVQADTNSLFTGTFTNEEQVYFDGEAKRPAPPWLSMNVTQQGDVLTFIEADAFGKTQSEPHTATIRRENGLTIFDDGKCQQIFRAEGKRLIADGTRGTCSSMKMMTAITPFAITITLPDGRATQLRRARPVTCWVSILKDKPKADGSEDWYFERSVALHDQGGRAQVGGGDTGAQAVVIRVRNVTWDTGSTNKPALTLYVHKPEKPARAEAYSWAAPNSSLLGVNLRWVQAGCGIGS
jgi:hypothetical protein